MKPLRPQYFTHRGSVVAQGFALDTALLGEAVARRRVWELWRNGAQVARHGAMLLVRLPEARRVQSHEAPGAPLVAYGKLLSALPLTEKERELFAPDSVVYARAGQVLAVSWADLSPVAPESWLDVSGFALADVKTLGLVVARPRLVAEPTPFDARARLDGVPPAAPEQVAALAEMRAQAQAPAGRPTMAASDGLLAGILVDGARAILGWFSKPSSSSPASGPGGEASLWDSLTDKLRGLTAHALRVTRLSALIGQRQAAYLNRMMEMFENGDLNAALRHAIPINDMPGALRSAPALGVPKPRAEVRLTPQRQAGSSPSIGLQDNALDYLHNLYRNAYERLAAQGRIEEAAFVLADLLFAHEEAVAFLEKHGRLKLAAELAEGRNLTPGLVVRLWFLAGDAARAMRLARRYGAWSDAVTRLEKNNKPQAQSLRVLWAESLAQAGHYAPAVDVIWPFEAERPRATAWMDAVIDLGGVPAARMLARKIAQTPDAWPELGPRAAALLEDESDEQRLERTAFASVLRDQPLNPQTKLLARVAARAVLRDAGNGPHAMTAKDFRALVNFAQDGALRADVPAWPAPTPPKTLKPETFRLDIGDADTGATPLYDAALLPDGRFVVALGEAGVKLLSRDGRTLAHFDQPAQQLVLADNADRAIALAQRGDMWRLARLDFLTRRANYWCDTKLDAFAPDYDGALWFVGAQGDFYALDANAKNFDALWRVPDTGNFIFSVSRTTATCRFLTGKPHAISHIELEKWTYQLPLMTLRNRATFAATPPGALYERVRPAFSANGIFVDQSRYHAPSETLNSELKTLRLRLFDTSYPGAEWVIGDENAVPLTPLVQDYLCVSPVCEPDGARVRLFDLRAGRLCAEIFLARARQARPRLTEQALLLADDCGRLLVWDIGKQTLTRNLRL